MSQSTRKVSVENLCQFAGIEYGVLDGPQRLVSLVRDGGQKKIPVTGRQRAELVVDLDVIPGSEKIERTLKVLQVLAVDLDCYEAGESLAQAGLVETLSNGRFVLRELTRSR
jgi:hypothetical protein